MIDQHKSKVQLIEELSVLRRQVNTLQEQNRQLILQMSQTEKLFKPDQLAVSLAHEINNPLQAIQSHLDLALDFPLPRDEREHRLNIVRQEIDQLNGITKRLLSESHSESSTHDLTTYGCTALPRLIDQVLSLTEQRLQEEQVQVNYTIIANPMVEMPPPQLTQVFINLIMNAMEAMEQGGNLDIEANMDDKWAIASISNTGSHIAQEDLPHIFEPFYTTKSDGNGLGLWICHNLIQKYGGTLTVKNRSHAQGVTFLVKLPHA